MEISEMDYKILIAYKRTLNDLHMTKGLCLKCEQAILIDGQVCSNCYFDYSAKGENEHAIKS